MQSKAAVSTAAKGILHDFDHPSKNETKEKSEWRMKKKMDFATLMKTDSNDPKAVIEAASTIVHKYLEGEMEIPVVSGILELIYYLSRGILCKWQKYKTFKENEMYPQFFFEPSRLAMHQGKSPSEKARDRAAATGEKLYWKLLALVDGSVRWDYFFDSLKGHYLRNKLMTEERIKEVVLQAELETEAYYNQKVEDAMDKEEKRQRIIEKQAESELVNKMANLETQLQFTNKQLEKATSEGKKVTEALSTLTNEKTKQVDPFKLPPPVAAPAAPGPILELAGYDEYNAALFRMVVPVTSQQ
jgi:hypothetical protein